METRRSKDCIERCYTPHLSIWSTGMDRGPKETTQCHKTQKGAKTGQYKNRESIPHCFKWGSLIAKRHDSYTHRSGKSGKNLL
jgi:hypothetical protein